MGMQPTAAAECTVTDLLERILDKGLVIHADLIVSLAGVPLVGVTLKAAIAGMETMLKWGMLVDWDEKMRDWSRNGRKESQKARAPLADGEEILVKMFGSHWYCQGIYRCWRPGHLYVTDRRVLLWRPYPGEVLMEVAYELIRGMAVERRLDIAKTETDHLYILLKDGEVAQLHHTDVSVVKEAIEKRMVELRLELESNPTIPPVDEGAGRFLTPGEGVTHYSRMWHLVTLPSTGGTTRDGWKPGHLYLTNKRMYWYHDFDGNAAWETPRDSLVHATTRLNNLQGILGEKQVLNVLYKTESGNRVACFCGVPVDMQDWEDALADVIRQRSEPVPEDWEPCPQCGEKAPRQRLVKEGCSVCGWVSPRLRRKV